MVGKTFAGLGPDWDPNKPVIRVRPITNFEMDVSRVRLQKGVWIQRPSRQDSRHFYWPYDGFVIKAIAPADDQNVFKPFENVIAALRILQRNVEVGLADVVAYQQGGPRPTYSPGTFRLPALLGLLSSPSYVLSRRQLPHFKLVFGNLSEGVPRAERALARFAAVHRRPHSDNADRLIDVWVGLESLFSEGAQDLSYKVPMRIAHFVGRDGDHRHDWFRALRRSYRKRSNIVHGKDKEEKIPSQDGEAAIEALRLALLKVLSDKAIPALDRLDQLIARGRG